MTDIFNCPICGGTHYGSNKCPQRTKDEITADKIDLELHRMMSRVEYLYRDDLPSEHWSEIETGLRVLRIKVRKLMHPDDITATSGQ